MSDPAVVYVAPRRAGGFWFLLLGLLLGVLLGGFGARYWFQGEATRQFNTMKSMLQNELVEARAELAASQAHIDALTGNLMVEEGTRKGLESTLQSTQAELGQAREHLAFFEQLFPPGKQGAVSIRGLEAKRQGAGLQYRAIFMRNANNAPKFEGVLQFVVEGRADGKPLTVTLENRPQLEFDAFQRSAGILNLPEGFEPDKLTLNVLEGKAVRASHTVDVAPAE
ncbi:hypothetical protein H0A71_17495 [Alcaligenaceae bacterium]|nr:hypothetical protein [Alcaligenaceae bacterium]